MKKLIAGLLAAAMLAVAAVGCAAAPSQGAGSQGTATPATDGKSKITLWHYMSTEGSQAKFQSYVDEFNAQSTTTHVEVTVLPYADFKTQLTVGAVADSLPSLAMIDNCDTVSFAAMGILEDVSATVADWETTQKYFDQIIATCSYEGGIYGLPLESNNLEIMYNKDIFDAANVPYPTADWTFDELVATAKQVTTDKNYGFAISGVQSEESTYQFLPFFWTAGGNSMELNSEAGKTALGMLAGMVGEGTMPKECITWTQSELASQFKSGNVAMHVMGCWNLGPYTVNNVNFGVVEVPSMTKGGEKKTVYGGENLCVVKGPHTESALEFLEWFGEYDRISEWNYYIDHFVASEDTLTDARYDTEQWAPFIDMVPNSVARDVVTYWPEVSAGYQMAIQMALSGQGSVDEALVTGQAMIDQAIAKAAG